MATSKKPKTSKTRNQSLRANTAIADLEVPKSAGRSVQGGMAVKSQLSHAYDDRVGNTFTAKGDPST